MLESKVLKVVVYEDNAPFSWSEDGAAKGIDVDLGKALAREIGVEAEFIVRVQGEEVDDDLRANVWKGPLTGGGVGVLAPALIASASDRASSRHASISARKISAFCGRLSGSFSTARLTTASSDAGIGRAGAT